MTANPFQKATRAQLKARVAFAGPTGSGKTWTSLEWATVLADGGRVAVVDTERGSAALYADRFDFDVMAFDPPYDPGRLADILKAAEANAYDVVVVDSLSHFWEGEGGTRDIADAAAARSGGNSFAGWKDATPKLRHLIDVMLGLDAHFIGTMRSKMEYVLEQNERGRTAPRKVGLAPVMRQGVEYEFTLVGDIDLDHRIAITKSRCDRLADELVQPGRADEAAKVFADWLGEGEPLATKAEVDGLVGRIGAMPDEVRKACKAAFVEEIGSPQSLRQAQLEAAGALVARFEGLARGAQDDSSTGGPAAAASPSPGSHEDGGTPAGVPDGREPQAQQVVPSSSATVATGGEGSGYREERPQADHDGSEIGAPTPSGGVTADQLRQAVHTAHPDRDTARKQEITAAKTAASVAGALSIEFAGGFDDIVADQQLAAAVLADLAGDDKPPPPGGNGPAVGEQPPAQAPGSGPAPADPAPTADPSPLKAENAADWRKENARCQALAAEHLSADPETLKSQREALAYQASGGRVTSWADLTRTAFSQVRSWLEFIADGHGRLVESDRPEHFGWQVLVEEAA